MRMSDREAARAEYRDWLREFGYDFNAPGLEDDDLLDRWERTLAQAREEGRREGQNTGVALAIQAMEAVLLGSKGGRLSPLELYQHCKAETARRILEEDDRD